MKTIWRSRVIIAYHWLHNCSYNPLAKLLSRISQPMTGFLAELEPTYKYPGSSSTTEQQPQSLTTSLVHKYIHCKPYGGPLMLPDAWADPKSRSTLGFCNLHHRSSRAQNWGIYFLDPPGGLGCGTYENACRFGPYLRGRGLERQVTNLGVQTYSPWKGLSEVMGTNALSLGGRFLQASWLHLWLPSSLYPARPRTQYLRSLALKIRPLMDFGTKTVNIGYLDLLVYCSSMQLLRG